MTHPGFQIGPPATRAPDPISYFELYRGVAWKRVVAYMIDVVMIAIIMLFALLVFGFIGILTFGMLGPLLIVIFALIPFCYHMLLLSGPRHATIGMRVLGLEMRSVTAGYPDQVQAAVQTMLFYLSVSITGFLILLWALFDSRRRCLHDIVAGTYVVNRSAAMAVPA